MTFSPAAYLVREAKAEAMFEEVILSQEKKQVQTPTAKSGHKLPPELEVMWPGRGCS